MSNVMSMKDIRNNPHRSAFDLSMRKCFTAKVGELLPVWFKEVIPGDKFKVKLNSFTRTMPLNTAAFTRIKEYYDFFFVPYRQLWRFSDQFLTGMTDMNPEFSNSITDSARISASRTPYFKVNELLGYLNTTLNGGKVHPDINNNRFGFDRSALTYKLLKYLGYGFLDGKGTLTPTHYGFSGNLQQFNDVTAMNYLGINAFPVLAYQKICQDYFRNTQWENRNPTLYNVDYLNGNDTHIPLPALAMGTSVPRNMLDLNYAPWNKDLFMGLIPSPQFGETATISGASLPPILKGDIDFSGDSGEFNAVSYEAQTFKSDTDYPQISGANLTGSGFKGVLNDATFQLSSNQISGFSVLALRQAEALQKFREITISGNPDYKSQIEKHFGIKVSELRSNLCSWLGGSSSILDIGEVVNTNLQGVNSNEDVQADIAGRGVGSSDSSFDYDAKEHGIIMCIYHSVPVMDYADDITDPYMLKGSRYDYAIPEFDSVGMQSVPGILLSPDFSNAKNPTPLTPTADMPFPTSDLYHSLGYAPRYYDYKTSVDVVTGAFTRNLKYWSAPMTASYFKSVTDGNYSPKVTSNFFYVNPAILDTIFAVNSDGSMDTDNLLVSTFSDIKAVRNLDYNGLPY